MAITINVNGVNSGGGNNNQPPTPPSPTPQPQSQPYQPSNNWQPPVQPQQPQQPIRYQRPDFNQFSTGKYTGATDSVLPTSERMVNDVRAEISRRGIILVPGTQNFSTMLNTLRQNQQTANANSINQRFDDYTLDVGIRYDSAVNEIKRRIEESRQSELAGITDPTIISAVNKKWDKKFDYERERLSSRFDDEMSAASQERDSQIIESENRLAEAMQRLTEELSQGNKDSYLNNLRDKYKEQIWRRDNAGTEEEVREASREAAKIQERMQRGMTPGASPALSKWLGVAGTVLTTAMATGVNLDRIGIQQDYVGFDMASSILNGNAFSAIRQENALKKQNNAAIYGGAGAIGGALAGAAIGSAFGGVGAIPGYAIGAIVGGLIGTGAGTVGTHIANREMMIEDERTRVAELWKQEESRMMAFNDLVMLTRGKFGNPNDIEGVRNSYILKSGAREWMSPDEDGAGIAEIAAGGGAIVNSIVSGHPNIWRQSSGLDIYDLGYTAPEFAQQLAKRIKQRGFAGAYYEENALYADALERVFSMNSGTLGQLSAYDRFRPNNANQDFANLAVTLDALKTTGMRNGQWARSDEFAGYMTQLQQGQRSTFLTVDNARAGRQIATGQAIFGDRFGSEVMQSIQQINNTIQNPKGGFAQTLLYDVVQELFPNTRGRIDLIERALYDPTKQNAIQQEYQRRIQSIYGGVDTTAGYLAAQEIWGIQNPNVMMPIVKQLGRKGGLEAQGLKKASVSGLTSVLNNGYTPETTQNVNAIADQQMKSLLYYQDEITTVVRNILDKLETSIDEKLQEAIDNLKN